MLRRTINPIIIIGSVGWAAAAGSWGAIIGGAIIEATGRKMICCCVSTYWFKICVCVEQAGSGGVSVAMGMRIAFSTSLKVFFCLSIFDTMISIVRFISPFYTITRLRRQKVVTVKESWLIK